MEHVQRWSVVLSSLVVVGSAIPCARAAAAGIDPQSQSHLGAMIEFDGDFGGDTIARGYSRHGSAQHLTAGEGLTPAVGLHYQFGGLPVDLEATVGYKVGSTSHLHPNFGLNRFEFKTVAVYELPRGFYVDAGPVWHTGIRFSGDENHPDFSFNDAVGATVGVGFGPQPSAAKTGAPSIGLAYTYIHYSSPITGDVDASSIGLSLAWKF